MSNYIVISIKAMLSGPDQVQIHSIHETREEAEEVAAGPSPDYDPQVGCSRLGHNQASATDLVVGEANWCDPSDLWGMATQDELDRAMQLATDGEGDELDAEEVDDQYLWEAMAEAGRYIIQDPETMRDYWLVDTNI